jgi:hypothetical protein
MGPCEPGTRTHLKLVLGLRESVWFYVGTADGVWFFLFANPTNAVGGPFRPLPTNATDPTRNPTNAVGGPFRPPPTNPTDPTRNPTNAVGGPFRPLPTNPTDPTRNPTNAVGGSFIHSLKAATGNACRSTARARSPLPARSPVLAAHRNPSAPQCSERCARQP